MPKPRSVQGFQELYRHTFSGGREEVLDDIMDFCGVMKPNPVHAVQSDPSFPDLRQRDEGLMMARYEGRRDVALYILQQIGDLKFMEKKESLCRKK